MPPVSVSISESHTPTLQMSYTLSCNLDAPSSLDLTSPSYSWLKNGVTLNGEFGYQLNLGVLQESDNNTDYKCRYMASSQYLMHDIDVTSTTHQLIIIGMLVYLCLFLFRAGAQKVYLCKKGHNYGPHFLERSTPLIIKKCCCQVWGVALYLKSLN